MNVRSGSEVALTCLGDSLISILAHATDLIHPASQISLRSLRQRYPWSRLPQLSAELRPE